MKTIILSKYKYVLIIIVLLALIISQAGCGIKGEMGNTGAEEPPFSAQGFYLDTICTITIYAGTEDALSKHEEILSDALELCGYYESLFSRTREGSDIWRVNNAEGEAVECDAETVSLIEKALYYCELSEGCFDITVGGLYKDDMWDFHQEGEARIPSPDRISQEIAHVDYKNVKVEGNKVTLLDPAANLDLGGIAKGYIADRIGDFMEERGVTGAVIDLGGNLEILGYKDGSQDAGGKTEFNIGIRKPFSQSGEIITSVKVHDGSLVTSGVYERSIEADGKKYHHILDPSTGYPVQTDLVSVTIIGAKGTSTDCDALATICLIMGAEQGKKFMESLEGYEALFIDESGTITEVS